MITGFFAKLKNAVFSKENGAPGESVVADAEGIGSNSDDAELTFPSGFYGIPQDAIQGVIVNIGGQNVVVSNMNYGFDKKDVLDKGSSMIYGYDSDGVVKGYVLVDAEGLMAIKNDVTSMKTILDNFSTEGGPTKQFTSAASKIEIAKLFKE